MWCLALAINRAVKPPFIHQWYGTKVYFILPLRGMLFQLSGLAKIESPIVFSLCRLSLCLLTLSMQPPARLCGPIVEYSLKAEVCKCVFYLLRIGFFYHGRICSSSCFFHFLAPLLFYLHFLQMLSSLTHDPVLKGQSTFLLVLLRHTG